MPQIRLLDQATVNKIAAGEVVERPASVVKEMLDNAVDAGADKVTVEIRSGGCELIRITDNGCGIDKEQVRTAFLRHSTSKIRQVEDLLTTTSLGFRGEALASIAAVARVEMLTKTADQMTGVRFVIEGGVEKVFEEVACPTGTTIRVENLFFNTPARKKFLKKPTAEAAAVTDLMQRMVLAHPEISIRYLNNKKEPTLYSSGNGNIKNTIYTLYGRDMTDKMIPIEGCVPISETESMTLRGYISRPQMVRANRSYESFFINGRYIRSQLLEKAMDEAYKDLIMPGTFPVCVIHIDMDPACLDVNVHPTKMEIRFMKEATTREGVYDLVSATLKEQNLIRRVGDFYAEKPESKELSESLLPKKDSWEQAKASESVEKRSSEEKADPSDRVFIPAQKPGSVPYENASRGYAPRGYAPHGAVKTSDYHYEWKGSARTEGKGFFFEEDKASYKAVDDETTQTKPASYTPPKDEITQTKPASYTLKNDEMTQTKPASYKAVDDETALTKLASEFQPIQGEQITVHEDHTPKPRELKAPEEKISVVSEKMPHQLKLIGQIFKTYWLAEENDVCYLMDQHAAHERVYYDRYRALLKKGNIDTQMLITPVVCNADPRSVAELDEYAPIFEKLGYRVEAFGEDAVIVRGVPFLFNRALPAEDITNMIDMIREGQMDSTRDLLLEKIAMMSCKAAVKGNDALSFAEAKELLDQLFACENPYNCPHGRPTMISLTKYELEKRFMRIV